MVLMCMPYEGMPLAYSARLEQAATVISLLFMAYAALEAIVKARAKERRCYHLEATVKARAKERHC